MNASEKLIKLRVDDLSKQMKDISKGRTRHEMELAGETLAEFDLLRIERDSYRKQLHGTHLRKLHRRR